jgi:hypothetical protein
MQSSKIDYFRLQKTKAHLDLLRQVLRSAWNKNSDSFLFDGQGNCKKWDETEPVPPGKAR